MTPSTHIARSIRETPNKGRLHVLLGHPESDGDDKTTVAPGNVFSPGLGTCGVSLWIETADGRLWTPDTLPDDAVSWGFTDERDGPPVLRTHWAAGDRLTVAGTLCHLGGPEADGADFCLSTLSASEADASEADASEAGASSGLVEGVCFLVVRDAGPAGAKIASLAWDESALALLVGGGPTIKVEQPPASVEIVPADAKFDSPLALLRYPFALGPGEEWTLAVKAEHGFAGRASQAQAAKTRPFAALPVSKGILHARLDWLGQLPTRLYAPDPRLARVWNRSAYHLLAAMENGLPRSGVAGSPDFRVRDGVLLLRALDLMGRLDLGRAGCDFLAPRVFSGGSEADAPGEGIWALVSHALVTEDFAWLRGHFPHIQERVAWLERMVDADAPILTAGLPGDNALCRAAQDGLIQGVLPWERSEFYVNAWAVAGFRQAVEAADALGEDTLRDAWQARADRLEDAITQRLLPRYGTGWDAAAAPHPTGVLADRPGDLRGAFEGWYRANRLHADRTRRPEPHRPSLEVGQIHNAFRLGLDDLAWAGLNELLDEGGTAQWQVSAFSQGFPGGVESVPHGGAAAEWILLLRDLFVRDDGTRLMLGQHIPPAWLVPGASFGARDLPTRFGLVSYRVTMRETVGWDLDYDGPPDYVIGWEPWDRPFRNW